MKKTTSSNKTQSPKKRRRSHTKSLHGGFARKIQETRRQEKKTQALTPKEQKAAPSREPSRKF